MRGVGAKPKGSIQAPLPAVLLRQGEGIIVLKLSSVAAAIVAISMVASVSYAGSIRYVDDDAPLGGDAP